MIHETDLDKERRAAKCEQECVSDDSVRLPRSAWNRTALAAAVVVVGSHGNRDLAKTTAETMSLQEDPK